MSEENEDQRVNQYRISLLCFFLPVSYKEEKKRTTSTKGNQKRANFLFVFGEYGVLCDKE